MPLSHISNGIPNFVVLSHIWILFSRCLMWRTIFNTRGCDTHRDTPKAKQQQEPWSIWGATAYSTDILSFANTMFAPSQRLSHQFGCLASANKNLLIFTYLRWTYWHFLFSSYSSGQIQIHSINVFNFFQICQKVCRSNPTLDGCSHVSEWSLVYEFVNVI